jgi:hypothetical protein
MNKRIYLLLMALLPLAIMAQKHWVGTWGTAIQLVEPHNCPPQPGLGGNSLRQIVQVSIGGKEIRLKLSNQYSTSATEIKGI